MMRRADRRQRGDFRTHSETRDHVSSIESAHRMCDDDRSIIGPPKNLKLAKDRLLQLPRAISHARCRMNARDNQRMTARGNRPLNPAGKVRQPQRADAEIAETEEAVMEDDGKHCPSCTPPSPRIESLALNLGR